MIEIMYEIVVLYKSDMFLYRKIMLFRSKMDKMYKLCNLYKIYNLCNIAKSSIIIKYDTAVFFIHY